GIPAPVYFGAVIDKTCLKKTLENKRPRKLKMDAKKGMISHHSNETTLSPLKMSGEKKIVEAENQLA
ncbi:hypothetical protein E2320_004319, partial [Naja naja]